ncbi:MAG: hypothetical protein ACK5S6_05390 [bacterium]|jgi:hypothetical protein
MADNVGYTPGSGASIAADDIGGNLFQRVKLIHGVDGTNDGDVSSANPFPVTDARLPALATTHPLSNAAGVTVRQAPAEIFAVSFSKVGSALMETDQLTQRRLGTGVGVSQSSGNLVLTTGTTANAEFLARSISSFRGAFTARFKTILSQRIANQNFVMLLADSVGEGLSCTINSATSISVTKTDHGFTADNVGQSMYVGAINGAAGVPGRYAIASIPNANTINFTVAGWPASGSCTVDLFGWNYVRTAYSGTSATSAFVDAQRNGWNSGDTTATINTTASPGHVIQMYADTRNINWSDTLVASSTTPNVTTRASRIEAIPDDEVPLYWFIWLYNGSVAPASTTTWTIGFVAVEDNANVPAYIAGVRPLGSQAALPVAFPAAQAVTVSSGIITTVSTLSAISAGANLIGDVGQQYRANATGAASGTHIVSGASTNATVVKASAGRLLGFVLTNNAASKVYVKFHNQTTTPTAGTGVVRSFGIPAGGTLAFSLEGGIAFSTGIALTTVTGAADSDATAVAANDIVGDVFFA